MPEYVSYSKQDNEIELSPELLQLTGETLSTDIRLVGGVFNLLLEVTSEQYNRLLSAAIEGAYAAYPDDYNNVISPLILAGKRLAESMSCEDVANCIETDETVQDAISDLIVENNNQYGNSNPDYITPSAAESEPLLETRFEDGSPLAGTCNLDELWGGIYFLVQRLDQSGRDALESIVAKVDKWERAAEFIDNVPIVGTLAQDLILTFIDVVPDLLEFYDAYSTEEHLQEIACDLFSLVCSQCRYPTHDEILSYYAGWGMEGLEDYLSLSLKAVVDYVIGSSTFAAQVAYFSIITFQLWIMYAESTWLGRRGKKWIGIWLDNGEEYANDAWQVLCDPCTPPVMYIDYDFTVSDGGFTSSSGTWQTGVGWVANITTPSAGNYRANMTISKTFTVDGKIFAGGIIFDSVSNCGIEEHYWKYYLDGVEVNGRQIGSMPNGTNLHRMWTNNTVSVIGQIFDRVDFKVNAADCDGVSPHGGAIIKRARIYLTSDSELFGTPSIAYPTGFVLPSGGSSDTAYWQP